MFKNSFSINGIAKKSALAVMLASAVTLGASTPIKNTRQEKEPQQTELMSQKAAEALKVNSLLQDTIPSVHNKKLDDMLFRFYEKDEDKIKVKEFIQQLYDNWGTYGASALIQTQIDVNMFVEFLNGNVEILKKFPYGEVRYTDATEDEYGFEYDKRIMNPINEIKKTIIEWLEPNYSKVFAPVFSSFDHKPGADELNAALDNYVEKNEYQLFRGKYFNEYSNPIRQYKNKQANNKQGDIQNNSNLIAYKIHCANLMLFSNLLHSNGIKNGDLYSIFYSGYMQAVCP